MSKGKAPKAPDPRQTAMAQMQANQATAGYEQAMNMVDQVGPDGSLTYSQSGYRDVTDPFTGKITKVPAYTATTALSSGQQALKGETDAAEFNMANAAKLLSANIGGDPFKGGEATEAKLYDLGSKRLQPQIDADRARAETSLANRGIRLGSKAYDTAQRQQGEKENDQWNQLALTGNQQAWQQAMQEYNNPIDRISALLSGSQVNSPNAGFVNTPNSSVANTDYAGLVNANYAQQMEAYKAKQANAGGALGGLFGLGGKLGAAAIEFSDRRLKENIKKVGKTDDGLNVFTYRYKGTKGMRLGLMAQEVEKKKPEAVIEHPSGFKMVDYDRALSAS